MAQQQDRSAAATQGLASILQDALTSATFAIRRFGSFSAQELREVYAHGLPVDVLRTRRAQPALDGDPRSRIDDALRGILADHVEGGLIGNGFSSIAQAPEVVPVANIADSVTRAAALVGPEEAAHTLVRWANGALVQYEWCALLDGLTVDQARVLEDYLRVETLSASSLSAFAYLPLRVLDLDPASVAGTVKVTITSEAVPAFFPPSRLADGQQGSAQELSLPAEFGPMAHHAAADILCKALSLECDHYVGWTMRWVDCVEERPFGLAEWEFWPL